MKKFYILGASSKHPCGQTVFHILIKNLCMSKMNPISPIFLLPNFAKMSICEKTFKVYENNFGGSNLTNLVYAFLINGVNS